MNNLEIFEPGSKIKTLGLSRKCQLEFSNFNIRFPSRIHMTPIDCNRFEFGKPGGGGVGFAIEVDNRLQIAKASRLEITANRSRDIPLIKHYIHVLQELFGSVMEFHFDLTVSGTVKQHFGLGSSVSVACAVVFGLNKMHGEPLLIEEMRRLIAHNFVEEFGGKLSYGLETGVGTSVILRGGISIIGGELVEVFHGTFPPGYTILLIDPHAHRPDSDKPESQDMLHRTFFLDTTYRYTKAYNILMDIIPALHKGDFRTVGDYIWDIQYSGTHLSMIQSYEDYGKNIYDVLGCLRRAGAPACGLSSVGPAIYAIIEEEKGKDIIKILKSQFLNLDVASLKVNNCGITEIHIG